MTPLRHGSNLDRARVVALIPAAGRGVRFGGNREKQFFEIAGKPLLAHTLDRFQRSSWIQEILLIVPVSWISKIWAAIVEPHNITKVKKVVAGGDSRQESVRIGLEALMPEWDLVLIHDGARPLVTEDMIEQSVRQARIHGATLVGVPASDTIVEADEEGIACKTLDRRKIWLVQTPQCFRYDLILKAHLKAAREGFRATDDASLVARLGVKARLLRSSEENIKVTTRADARLAEVILRTRNHGSTR